MLNTKHACALLQFSRLEKSQKTKRRLPNVPEGLWDEGFSASLKALNDCYQQSKSNQGTDKHFTSGFWGNEWNSKKKYDHRNSQTQQEYQQGEQGFMSYFDHDALPPMLLPTIRTQPVKCGELDDYVAGDQVVCEYRKGGIQKGEKHRLGGIQIGAPNESQWRIVAVLAAIGTLQTCASKLAGLAVCEILAPLNLAWKHRQYLFQSVPILQHAVS